jgi:hypothetical protein
MIVQPDFCAHWKTRLLVQLTHDESSPMAVLRLWAHCQHSKRSIFPEMTAAQLASVCFWGNRKPACAVALVRAGFVERLKPNKGFMAHQWSEHNAQLLQKWAAGSRGGRPAANLSESDSLTAKQRELVKMGDSEKPTGYRPLTVLWSDQSRSDQSRSDQSRSDQSRSDQRDPIRGMGVDGAAGSPPADFKTVLGNTDGLDGLVKTIAQSHSPNTGPTVEDALDFARARYAPVWGDAERWVRSWHERMTQSHWLDRKRRPIAHWQRNLISYCDVAWRNLKGVKS